MDRFLAWLATAATRRPRLVVFVLAAVTAGMAAFASSLEVEVDLSRLGREDADAVQAMERVRDEFSDPGAAVQVILDAGDGGDMLTRAGLEAVRAAEEVVVDALGSDARTDEAGGAQVLSLASAVDAVTTQQGLDPANVDDEHVAAVASRGIVASPQLAGLVSDDFDPEAGVARATVLVVPLDPGLAEQERTEAGERVQTAFDDPQDTRLADVRVTVFSSGLFATGLLEAIRAEVPLLFALALLVVLVILAAMYRSVFDVAVGLVGLLTAVVWTLGFAALLGPAYLGVTGPMTQLVVVIPVLLVGLGIDYSVHLTARYREQRAAGQPPAAAAGRALHTVGAALVLATAATAVGFGSIAVAPLQMLADFGVFLAVGVVCAFVVMGLWVPAARVWRDRRERTGPAAVREVRLGWLMRGPVWLTQRQPAAVLLVAALLVGASLFAATGLDVDFDRDDFVPEGTSIQTVLAHQDELFGGGVTESTFVLVDGDLTDPTVANAVWRSQQRVADVPGVRTVGGTPQVLSVISLAAAVHGPATAPPLAGDAPAEGGPPREAEVSPPLPMPAPADDGFTEDADLGALYEGLRETIGEQRVEQLLSRDAATALVQIRTTGGDAGAERLQRDIERAFAPVERAGAAVSVTSEPIIIAEMSEDLSAFQAQAIGLTLIVVLALLTVYYALDGRRWMLGIIAMIPAVVSAALILGTMWLLGISFNVLTATLTAIAVGIGVPYGVHVVNRFVEDLEHATVGDAAANTLRATGAALTGSALTTLGAFVVLAFSGLPPMRSLGLLGGSGIAFALLAAVLVEPGALVLWGRRHDGPSERAGAPATAETAAQRVEHLQD